MSSRRSSSTSRDAYHSRSRSRSRTPLRYSSHSKSVRHRHEDYSRSPKSQEYKRNEREQKFRKEKKKAKNCAYRRESEYSNNGDSESSSTSHSRSLSSSGKRKNCDSTKLDMSPKGDDSEKRNCEKIPNHRSSKEDLFWEKRREERSRHGSAGVRSIWGRSPLIHEIREIYENYELLEGQNENLFDLPKLDNDNGKIKKKMKNGNKSKEKKKKQKEKKKKRDSSDSEEEWVEVTAEMRQAEAAREKMEEASMIGPTIPEHLLQKEFVIDHSKKINYGKDMLRGEAAAMAAYVAQGKRIPRRGEIGLSSVEISEFEKIGYVMSGTRHKSMEATRLRKENQVMTAEEKRLLSGFTHEERKKKEEIVLQQFRSFIESKKGKS